MGETAAAGGVFMGLGLRGVRGRGAAEAVGVTEAPLAGGPKSRVKREQQINKGQLGFLSLKPIQHTENKNVYLERHCRSF